MSGADKRCDLCQAHGRLEFLSLETGTSIAGKEIPMYKIARLIYLTVLVTIMLLLPTSNASAALVRCRTDPIFVLSNGDVLSVILDIGTTSTNVKNIHYVLHVPAGVTVKKVAYTNVNLRLPESYQVYQNSSAKTYTVDTFLTTSNSARADVTVFIRLNEDTRKTVAGYSGRHLIATLVKYR